MKTKLSLLFALFVITANAYTQNPPCMPDYPGLTFSTPELTTYPPYSLNMPFEVLLGYVALDSVSYNAWDCDVYDFINSQTYNDTLRYIMKYYYLTQDYDPLRFDLCSFYSYRRDSLLKSSLSKIYLTLLPKIRKESPNSYTDFALFQPDFIAHILVHDTIIVFDEDADFTKEKTIVTGEIIDMIKGKVIPSCKHLRVEQNPPIIYSKSLVVPDSGTCFQFHYCDEWMQKKNRYPYLPEDIDSAWVRPGKEYIVFLNIEQICGYADSSYYCVRPFGEFSYTFWMYPVRDGIVYDPDNDFGFGLMLPVSEFKAALRSRIDEIIHYGE